MHLQMGGMGDHEKKEKKVKSAMKCHVFVEHGSEHQVVACCSVDFWGQKSEWVDWLETIESKQGLKYPLFATKVYKTASLNAQHILETVYTLTLHFILYPEMASAHN